MSCDKGDIPNEGETALGLERPYHREACRHQSGLSILGQSKIAFRPFEHQSRQLLRQSVVDFFKEPARRGKGRGEGASHADDLRALTRKYKCSLHPKRIPPSANPPT